MTFDERKKLGRTHSQSHTLIHWSVHPSILPTFTEYWLCAMPWDRMWTVVGKTRLQSSECAVVEVCVHRVFTGQIQRAPWQLLVCVNLTGAQGARCLPVRVYLDKFITWICRLSTADGLPSMSGPHPICWSLNRRKGWEEFSLCLIVFELGHQSLPAFGLRLGLELSSLAGLVVRPLDSDWNSTIDFATSQACWPQIWTS